MSMPPSTLFGVERSAFNINDRDCRVFKVQVASAPYPPPRQPWQEAAVIANRAQFVESINLVLHLLTERIAGAASNLSSAARAFGDAAVKSHELVEAWQSRQKAEPCPDPRTPRSLPIDEQLAGFTVMKLEEQFRRDTEHFLCLASQVASLSATARASVSIIGVPTGEREPAALGEDIHAKERQETEEKISALKKENQELKQEIQTLREEINKKGQSSF